MLKQRVITAVVLLLMILPALFYPSPAPFCALTLVFISASGWEWGRLNGYSQVASLFCATLVGICCGVFWFGGFLDHPQKTIWLTVSVVWIVVGSGLLLYGPNAWAKIPPPFRFALGVLILSVAWLAIAQARVTGVIFLLSVLTLVWVADIAAYFSGRALGGRFFVKKLAPSISPGKTWEGVLGGMAGVVVLALAWLFVESYSQAGALSIYGELNVHQPWVVWVAILVLVGMSVVGDLFESLIKRSAGVKDSSGLLPGHGGVLDRIDALLPTLPIAMMFYSFTLS